MLAGQPIQVTGATRAIGQAICTSLAAAGARGLTQHARNPDAAADFPGRTCTQAVA